MVRNAALLAILLLLTARCVHTTSEPDARTVPLTATARGEGSASYTVAEVAVDSTLPPPIGSCSLGTTIYLPKDARAVVLFIHGSGPMDRDGHVGRWTPYKDLAEQLAEAGYASIRFDKRAKVTGCTERLGEHLRADHFLKDVVEVAALAKSRRDLQALPLVLLGHSEGVTYANELVVRGWLKPDALVLIAGLGRYPLDATVLRQLRDAMLKPGIDEKARRETEVLLKQGETYFMRLREGEAKPQDRYFGAYAQFWDDEIKMTEQAALTAHQVTIPSLVLQGSRDENVTREDFDALTLALAKTPKSAAVMLPGLDHLLMRPEGTSVDPEVGATIVHWLDGLGLSDNGTAGDG